jgi:hypothetical protein
VISLRAGHFEIVVLKFVDVDDGVKDICNFMRFVDARALQTRLGVSVFSQKRQGKKDATMFSNVRRVPVAWTSPARWRGRSFSMSGEDEGGGWNGMTNPFRGYGSSGGSSSLSPGLVRVPSLGLVRVEVDVICDNYVYFC